MRVGVRKKREPKILLIRTRSESHSTCYRTGSLTRHAGHNLLYSSTAPAAITRTSAAKQKGQPLAGPFSDPRDYAAAAVVLARSEMELSNSSASFSSFRVC
jgi:hypothetical protein